MSKWRDKYKVHPAADVFPMLEGKDLDELAEDIRADGLKVALDSQRKAGKDILLKRTSLIRALTSANDPKRTSVASAGMRRRKFIGLVGGAVAAARRLKLLGTGSACGQPP